MKSAETKKRRGRTIDFLLSQPTQTDKEGKCYPTEAETGIRCWVTLEPNGHANMPQSIPTVNGVTLDQPQADAPSILLDSPAWFTWLDAPTTTRFSYPLFNAQQGYIDGYMTARKEPRQRGGAYWSIYRRTHGRLRKVYVGASTAMTRTRLDQIAADFRQKKHAEN